MGVMFTYIAASFLYLSGHFNMSPGVQPVFRANAIAIMLGSLTVSLFRWRNRCIACRFYRIRDNEFVCSRSFIFLHFRVADWKCIAVCFYALPGSTLPSSTTLALDLERKNSGNALCIAWILMFLFGGVLSPLTIKICSIQPELSSFCCIGTWFCNHIATAYRFKGNQTIKEIHKWKIKWFQTILLCIRWISPTGGLWNSIWWFFILIYVYSEGTICVGINHPLSKGCGWILAM